MPTTAPNQSTTDPCGSNIMRLTDDKIELSLSILHYQFPGGLDNADQKVSTHDLDWLVVEVLVSIRCSDNCGLSCTEPPNPCEEPPGLAGPLCVEFKASSAQLSAAAQSLRDQLAALPPQSRNP